jgi:hypothetical protein
MYLSRLFGLTFGSDISLEVPQWSNENELNPPFDSTSLCEIDVEVRIAPISNLAGGLQDTEYPYFEGSVAGIARFWINPNRIVVDPEPDVDEAILRPILWGSAITILLQQRGYLVLHASSVAIADAAIAFLGTSGAGKSTLASAFQRQGYPVLSDDVLAIRFQQTQPVVYPGIALIKLLPDAAIALGETPENLPFLNASSPKLMQRTSSPLNLQYRLKKLYLLGIGPQQRIVALSGSEALLALIYHSRDLKVLRTQSRRAQHFELCSQLVKSIPFSRLERRKSLDDLSQIVDQVAQDLRHHGLPGTEGLFPNWDSSQQ